MARFVRHAGCPQCGSRDNLALYDDGSGWCFGCKKLLPREAYLWKPPEEHPSEDVEKPLQGDGRKLSAFCPDTGILGVLRRSTLTIPELLKAGAASTGRDTLAFTYYSPAGEPVCIQVRAYGNQGKTGPKYINRGSTDRAFPLYHYHPADHRVVITEDTLSALKVARVTNSFSALGTNIQTHKLIELLKRGFQKVYVWLDKDKWREGRDICEKAQWIGLSATALLTDDDPKYYSVEQIMEYLK